MHTLTLQLNDSVYDKLLSYLEQFQKEDIQILEDREKKEYELSSREEVQARVLQAEKNGNYISIDEFFTQIDKKIEELQT